MASPEKSHTQHLKLCLLWFTDAEGLESAWKGHSILLYPSRYVTWPP